MDYEIIPGDNRQTLKTLCDNSIDAIVTDPPYGIDFLGKSWDANTGALETYQECLRVLKPGGHILAFSAARTYHHLAITLEQAGFEIRDQLMWIYSSGFPKSQDIGRSIQRNIGVKEYSKIVDTTKNAGFGQTDHARVRAGEKWSTPTQQVGQVKCTDSQALQWQGWGTSLKPAHEPICMARKPIKQSIAKNVQTWGTGALNIDAARVSYTDPAEEEFHKKERIRTGTRDNTKNQKTSLFGSFAAKSNQEYVNDKSANVDQINSLSGRFPSNVLGEIPDYQKYFYCPKISRKERHIGFEELSESGSVGNNHPTVKPVALMEYLIKLITPPGGTVLDPFNGSGSTGMAATGLGFNYIGCELDANYVEISLKRIEAWLKEKNYNTNFKDLFE